MSGDSMRDLNSRLTRARVLMASGRHDEGLEELRGAVFDATKEPLSKGRARVEEVLRFAKDNDAFEDVEDILENESLVGHFFGHEWT
jgi:hypothetical protein